MNFRDFLNEKKIITYKETAVINALKNNGLSSAQVKQVISDMEDNYEKNNGGWESEAINQAIERGGFNNKSSASFVKPTFTNDVFVELNKG